MRQVYRIDSDGFYIEPVRIKETAQLPSDCVEVIPQEGLFRAKFVGGKFIEGATQKEIDTILGVPREKSQLELMQEQIDQLILDSLMGV